MTLPWHQYVMGIIYFLAGLNHFRQPRLYLKIIPDYLPNPSLLNKLSGIADKEEAKTGRPSLVSRLISPLILR